MMIRAIIGLLIALMAVNVKAQVQIDLLSMFSLTRVEGDSRFADESDLFAFIHAFALSERMNNAPPGQFEVLPGLFKDYECDVNFVHNLVDTASNFSVALADLANPTGAPLDQIDFVIGPSRSSTCVPVSFVTSTFSIPVFSPSCTSPELDDVLAHRFFARTIPSDEATAIAMLELLRTLPQDVREPILLDGSVDASKIYNNIAVIYQEDTYGSNFKDSLFENVVDNEIFFTFIPFTPGNRASIDKAIAIAADTKVNVFFGLFFADDIAAVTEEATKLGLMDDDKIWIFSDGILSTAEFQDGLGFGLEEGEEVPLEVLKTVNNSFLVQASGQVNDTLIELFQAQAFTTAGGYNLTRIAELLEVEKTRGVDEFDFPESDFSEVIAKMQAHANGDGVDDRIALTDFSLFSFDIILAIREYIEEVGCDVLEINGPNFIATLENIKFEGVTGPVAFDGSQSRASDASAFKLLNSRFLDEPTDVLVGSFDGETWTYVNEEITFNNGGRRAPLLVNPPQNVEKNIVPPEIKLIIYLLAGLIAGVTLILGLFTWMMSNRQVIKAAQPFFLFLMLFGVLISTVAIYIFPQEEDGGKESIFKCNTPFFLISIGLTVSYGSLVFKLQRVVQVANTTPDLRNQGNDSPIKSLGYLLILVFIECLIFGATLGFAPLVLEKRVVEEDDFGQPTETFDICSPKDDLDGGIYTLYFVFHMLFYIYGFRLILKVKDLSTDFQEGKWITLSVVSQFQLYLLGIPVVIAVGADNPGVRFLVVGLLVLFSNVILLTLIFGPKIMRVMNGDDKVTWQTSRKGGNTAGDDMYEREGYSKEEIAESYRRSLVNTLKTDEFGLE